MDPHNPATGGVVLAVDDTAANLRVLVDSLSTAGYEVLVASDGRTALDTARLAHPDLILLDVLMPGIDGYVTCAELKKDAATAQIPVIFMTALTETHDKVKAFELGAVDYITKPFEEAELLARVFTHLTIARLRLDLEKRNRQLEDLNRLKNEFMGMAAHDVRNPLASVLACADLVNSIADSAGPEKIRLFVQQISSAARRINAIVTNLLDVNAIDSGERRLNIQPHDLNGIVARVAQQNALKADAKQIKLVIEAPPTAVTSLVDESAAEQVIDNLVSNAVKYSPVERRVFVRVLSACGRVRVEVQDEGPGISQKDQAKMYGKFSRLTAKPTGGEPSTGLGLWIVKELTEAMRGSISCTSELGHGATFAVEWPMLATAAAVPAA